MFKKFFAALAYLTNSIRNLGDTFSELDDNLRKKSGLEERPKEELEHRPESNNRLDNKKEVRQ